MNHSDSLRKNRDGWDKNHGIYPPVISSMVGREMENSELGVVFFFFWDRVSPIRANSNGSIYIYIHGTYIYSIYIYVYMLHTRRYSHFFGIDIPWFSQSLTFGSCGEFLTPLCPAPVSRRRRSCRRTFSMRLMRRRGQRRLLDKRWKKRNRMGRFMEFTKSLSTELGH